MKLKSLLMVRGISAAAAIAIAAVAAAAAPYNVLMIVVDDLQPELGCYGNELAVSPNIDRLAQQGIRFTSAYAHQAVCAASRSSMLTGLRPDTTGVSLGETHFRTAVPNAVTLPQHFRQNGYHTQSVGKIFHGKLDDPPSWSAPSFLPQGLPGYGPAGIAIFARRQ